MGGDYVGLLCRFGLVFRELGVIGEFWVEE